MGSVTQLRRKAREQAFIVLFEKSFNPELSVEEIIRTATEYEIITGDDFTTSLALRTQEGLETIDGRISANLKGWTMSRISKVSLAVLRIAVCEMLFFDDIPVGVSINEAVELCKIYGSDDDRIFVNGVLGSVASECK
ncbi:MAG: transcription antitermination factor NusB [Clostridia bacterium]|nr:transcription antitermination factor NusB [Clostridia bacterium]